MEETRDQEAKRAREGEKGILRERKQRGGKRKTESGGKAG